MNEDRRAEIAMRWQVRALARMRKRMPGFLIREPIPIQVGILTPGKLGTYHGRSFTHPEGLIRLSDDHYGEGERACMDTLMHELLHAHVDRLGIREAPHGPTFRKLAVFFGLHSFGAYSWRWKFECPKCGRWTKTNDGGKKMCRAGCGPMRKQDHVKLSREERRLLLEGASIPRQR